MLIYVRCVVIGTGLDVIPPPETIFQSLLQVDLRGKKKRNTPVIRVANKFNIYLQ